jgi:hypothetical protein
MSTVGGRTGPARTRSVYGNRVGVVGEGVAVDLDAADDAAFVQRGPELAGVAVAGVRGQQQGRSPCAASSSSISITSIHFGR